MKTIFSATILFLLSVIVLHAQAPLVPVWNYRYGTIDHDYIQSVIKTYDNGYLLAGYTLGDSVNDMGHHTKGSYDFWVVKINANGMLLWENNYGGTDAEVLFDVIETADHGFLLTGQTASSVSGDVSEPAHGFGDCWVIKIDANGAKQWDHRFGNIYGENVSSVCFTYDGGFLLAGSTESPAGGDITDASFGSGDYWIIKINSMGIKEWDVRYGGDGDDALYSVCQTTDHGYLLGGFSNSDSSGNKQSQSFGGYDYWVVKIDSEGNKLWDKSYGGTGDDQLYEIKSESGSFVLAGWSFSQAGGNKTENTFGLSDYWIVKCNTAGDIIWDRDFGGNNNEDDIKTIIRTTDNGYFFTGASYSAISGQKTESNLGVEQVWMVKMNNNGQFEWDKTILTTGHDETNVSVESSAGCYVTGVMCNGQSGGYKTQPNYDSTSSSALAKYDFWVIKFCDSTQIHGEGISENNLTETISMYPNPAGHELSVTLNGISESHAGFSLFSADGKLLWSEIIAHPAIQYRKTIDIEFLPAGLYLLQVNTGNNIYSQRLLKQ